jgi:hypothetical protein
VKAATVTAAPSADNASASGAGSSQAARSTSRSDPLAEVQLMPVLWDDEISACCFVTEFESVALILDDAAD